MKARKQSSGDASLGSGRLLAAIAVLAVAFIVLVTSPAIETDGDAGATTESTDTLKFEIFEKDGVTVINGPTENNPTGEIITIDQSKENYLISSSQADGKTIIITMKSGEISKPFYIVYGDVAPSNPADIVFEMSGGKLNGLIFAYYQPNKNFQTIYGSSTTNSGSGPTFDNCQVVAGDVVATFKDKAETNGFIQQTFGFSKITSYTINIQDDANIEKIRNIGSNGDSGDVVVNIAGGTLGYITPQRARASSLTYNVTGGTIDYFTVGADTEGGNNNSAGDMQTSFITGNVALNIAEKAKVNHLILGGGVLSKPLKNAHESTANYTIDGTFSVNIPGKTLDMSLFFYGDGENEGKAAILYAYDSSSSGHGITYSSVKEPTDSSKLGMAQFWGGEKVIDSKKIIDLKAGELFFRTGTTFDGTIRNGNNEAEFTKIVAGTNGLFVKVGSVEISGSMSATEATAKIAQAGGDVVLKNLTITEGCLSLNGAVTVKGTVTINDGASLSIDKGTVVTVSGKLAGDGNVTNNGTINILTGGSASTDVTGNEPTYTPDFVPMPPTEDDFPGYVPSQTVEKEKKDDSTTQVAIVAAAIAVVLVAIIALLYKSR